MIKPQELRLGNWVYGFKTVWQVDAYDFGRFGDDEEGMPYEPIPLTPEWMERCGGKIIPGTEKCYIKLAGFGNRYLLLAHGFIYLDFSDDPEPDSTNIEYLHQLQNLYFALTGEELTIKYE